MILPAAALDQLNGADARTAAQRSPPREGVLPRPPRDGCCRAMGAAVLPRDGILPVARRGIHPVATF
jgi:hypothetical protein